jgi:hypothetical protein
MDWRLPKSSGHRDHPPPKSSGFGRYRAAGLSGKPGMLAVSAAGGPSPDKAKQASYYCRNPANECSKANECT